MTNKKTMPVVILCGGEGIRLAGEATYIPKGMVRVGHQPILWHVMKRYALFGYTKFILALGKKGDMIREYFLNYENYTNDIRIIPKERHAKQLTEHQENDWEITLVDTGDDANSGARIARCEEYIKADRFMVTYSDSVGNIDFSKLLRYHKEKKVVATVTGVIPPYREQEFHVVGGLAVGHFDVVHAKSSERYINGGYMVFEKKIFSYISSFNECRLESDAFKKLMSERKLAVYPHHGFWRWLDTDRDFRYFHNLVDTNQLYWLQE
jgi:glucose-1-phosphate cytidylyltransferase